MLRLLALRGGPAIRRRALVLVVLVCLGGSAAGPTRSAAAAPAIEDVALGFSHTCVLTSAGVVKCWGANESGELGDGTTTRRKRPVAVTGLQAPAVQVDAGGAGHTCALTNAGGVECWGRNRYGQLGDGTTIDRSSPVEVSGLQSGITQISVGGDHVCALTNAGGLWCWGHNDNGQLGDGTTTDSSVPVTVTGLGGPVAAVSAGGDHTCTVMSSGGAKCWGANGNGQAGDGTTDDRLTPVDVLGMTSGVAQISVGGAANVCALTTAGAVKCWGANVFGQLGDGTTIRRTTPVNVVGLSSQVAAVAAGGGGHACALLDDGAVRCWGRGNYGELGDGLAIGTLVPSTPVALPAEAAIVATGGNHTCVLLRGSGVACWGENADGQLGDGTLVQRDNPVDTFDAIAPTTTLTPTPAAPDGHAGSYATSAGVAISAADDPGGSGVSGLRCALDPATAPAGYQDLPSGCTGHIDVTMPGSHIVYAAAIDAAGNAGAPVTLHVAVGHTLSVLLADFGAGGARVTSLPAGIACPGACSAAFAESGAALSVAPEAGAQLVGWVGPGCTGAATCQAAATADQTVTAVVAAGTPATVVAVSGSGNVTGAGAPCSGVCRVGGSEGDPISLSAHAAPGAVFTGWTGACHGTGTCQATVSGPTLAVATFAPAQDPLTVTKAGSGGGTVSADTGAVNCGATCSGVYPRGSVVTLSAAAAPGSSFAGWLGEGCTGTSTCLVTMDAARSTAAVFTTQLSAPEAVRAVPGNHAATVQWVPPQATGGATITGYQVMLQPAGTTVDVGAAVRSATFKQLTNCASVSFTVRALVASGPGPSLASSPVSPAPALVTDTGYRHAGTGNILTWSEGRILKWCFDPANALRHSVTDTTGMALFDSGLRRPGKQYAFRFAAAATYHIGSTGELMTSLVEVKMKSSGSTIIWASAAPRLGDVSDIQVRQPGSNQWLNWKMGETATSAAFTSSDPLYVGPGVYGFQAELRTAATGAVTSWSPALDVAIA